MNKQIKIISIGIKTGELLSRFPLKTQENKQILSIVPKTCKKSHFLRPYCMEKFSPYDIKLSDGGTIFSEVWPSGNDLLTLDKLLYGARWLVLLVQLTTWETLHQAAFIVHMAREASICVRIIICHTLYHESSEETWIAEKGVCLFTALAEKSPLIQCFERAFETCTNYEEDDFWEDTRWEIEECLQDQIEAGEKYVADNKEQIKEGNL